jgi:NAD(P)-dependent dehydrogenase (short-subunit alcohol dehydrogenase family)
VSGAEEAGALGVQAKAFQADFSNLDQVLRLGEEAMQLLGGIYVLVNNAGITFNKPLFL